MLWRTSRKHKNVSCFPPGPPSPTGGRGEKNKGALQAGYARLQSPTKKFPFPPHMRGEGDRGQKLILNLQQSPGNLAFFSQWRYLCHASDFFADSLTADR